MFYFNMEQHLKYRIVSALWAQAVASMPTSKYVI